MPDSRDFQKGHRSSFVTGPLDRFSLLFDIIYAHASTTNAPLQRSQSGRNFLIS